MKESLHPALIDRTPTVLGADIVATQFAEHNLSGLRPTGSENLIL